MNRDCDILYYDGACPLCRREIGILEKAKDEHLLLLDLHQETAMPPGLSRSEMLKSLHLQKSNREIIKGLEANIAAWGHTKFSGLVRPLRWPIISRMADWIYTLWANRRFNKRYLTGQTAS